MATGVGFSRCSITSPLVMRPSRPVAAMLAGSSWFSVTILRTAGDSGASVFTGSATFAATGAGAAAAGLAGAASTAPSMMVPSRAPTFTVVPAGAEMIISLPDAGAGTSTLTLSVSSSTMGSSAFTMSPTFLNHFAIVASVTDSPRAGTRISLAIVFSFDLYQPRASSRNVFNSLRCLLINPVAVEAEAARPA